MMRSCCLGRDHPRIRGEHFVDVGFELVAYGSSPHTRGALSPIQDLPAPSRIIPAYAGSTRYAALSIRGVKDHPRIRGEHAISSLRLVEIQGSSPHTRGAPPCPYLSGRSWRIIPAYAGSTRRSPARRIRLPDHPRIRGEHIRTSSNISLKAGSSPHTRGAPGFGRARRRRPRIIPAYAGSTRARGCRSFRARDHPRIRGEHVDQVLAVPGDAGSSPHTRGAPLRCFGPLSGSRIIPAYAGSTCGKPSATTSPPDHPRIRGEHMSTAESGSYCSGSSPHTRGAPTSTASTLPWQRDHPRIRGEHGSNSATTIWSTGSSPHTRGARRRRPARGGWRGIIPAYAGSTSSIRHPSAPLSDHPRIRGEHPCPTFPL